MTFQVPQRLAMIRVLLLLATASATGSGRYDLSRFEGLEKATPMEKVLFMLKEMKNTSVRLQAEEASKHAQGLSECELGTSQTAQELEALKIKAEGLEASISEAKVASSKLHDELLEHQRTLDSKREQLSNLRSEHSTRAASFAKDLSDYNSAITSIARAKEVLAKEERAKAVDLDAAFIQLKSLEIPSDLGKDAHIFDDFKDLQTASGDYTSKAKSVEKMLLQLQTRFQAEKEELVNVQDALRATYQNETTTVQEQLDIADGAAKLVSTGLAERKVELETNQKDLTQSQGDLQSTRKFFEQFSKACAENEAEYKEQAKLRDAEIQALSKAVDGLSSTSKSSTAIQALLQARNHRKVDQPEASVNLKALLRLKSEAKRLHSKALTQTFGALQQLLVVGQPVDEAETSAPTEAGATSPATPSSTEDESEATTTASVSSETVTQIPAADVAVPQQKAAATKTDRLASVRTMITKMVTRLEEQAAKEAGQQAFCQQQLEQVEDLHKKSKADTKSHSAKERRLQGELAKLDLEVEELTAVVNEGPIKRQAMVQQRTDQRTTNEQAARDSDEAREAVKVAIKILKQQFSKPKTSFLQVQQPADSTSESQADQKASDSAAEPQAATEVSPSDSTAETTTTKDKPVEKQEATTKKAVAKQMPAKYTAAKSDNAKGESVVSLLEVLEDDMETMSKHIQEDEDKQAEMFNATIVDHDSRMKESAEQLSFMTTRLAELQEQLNLTRIELNTSNAELSKVEEYSEVLKEPCMMNWQYGDKSARRQEEIQALQEVYDSIDTEVAAPISLLEASRLVLHASNVTSLLLQMKDEVAHDLAKDAQVFHNTSTWCSKIIAELDREKAEQEARSLQLQTINTTSVQAQVQLEIQIGQARKEIDDRLQSMKEAVSMREAANKEYQTSAEELHTNIGSLSAALAKLNKTGNTSAAAILAALHIAGIDQKVLSLLAEGKARSDEQIMRGKQSPVVAQVIHDLKSQMETELTASQDKEASANATFHELKLTKVNELEAMEASMKSKLEKLTKEMSIQAQAKEDFEYHSAAVAATQKYFDQVKAHCEAVQTEFAVRNLTRTQELSSLGKAVSILSGSASVDHATAAQPENSLEPVGTSQPPVETSEVAAETSQAPTTQPDVAAVESIASEPPSDAAATEAPVSSGLLRSKKAIAANVALHTPAPQNVASKMVDSLLKEKRPSEQSVMSRIFHLARGVSFFQKTRHGQRFLAAGTESPDEEAVGPVLKDQLKKVILEIETMRSTLKEEGLREATMKETCITEKHKAQSQLEKVLIDGRSLVSSIQRINTTILDAATGLKECNDQLKEFNSSIDEVSAVRAKETAEYLENVKSELQRQEQLKQAAAALREFYSNGTSRSAPSKVSLFQAKNSNARTGKPDGFSKPSANHEGSSGVILLLDSMLDESQRLKKQLDLSEESAKKAHQKTLDDLRLSIDAKNHEMIVLQASKSEAEDELVKAQELSSADESEKTQLELFMVIIDDKCSSLLNNFDKIQASRASDIENLFSTKAALQGMI